MTFEAQPNIFKEETAYVPTVINEIELNALQGEELELVFNAGGIKDAELTAIQRFELYDKGYEVTLPKGEVTLPEEDITVH